MTITKLYTENRRRFIFKLYPYTRNYDIAEDLLQDAILKAHIKYEQYDPKKGALKGWFTKILFSCLWDYMREQRKLPQMLDIDIVTDSDLISYEEDTSLVDLLDQVKNPTHKKILCARMLLGCSYGEIAKMSGTTKNSVRKIVQRFRKGVLTQ